MRNHKRINELFASNMTNVSKSVLYKLVSVLELPLRGYPLIQTICLGNKQSKGTLRSKSGFDFGIKKHL